MLLAIVCALSHRLHYFGLLVVSSAVTYLLTQVQIFKLCFDIAYNIMQMQGNKFLMAGMILKNLKWQRQLCYIPESLTSVTKMIAPS